MTSDPATAARLASTDERTIAYPLGSGASDEIALAAGIKPMLRQLLPVAAVARAVARFETARFAVSLVPGAWVSRSGRLVPVDPAAAGAMTVLFVARDLAALAEARRCELAGGDDAERTLGRLLGYPRCCVDAYLATPLPHALVTCAAAALLRTKGRCHPRLNVLDLAVFHYLSWSPCAFDCALATAYADRVASLVGHRFPAFQAAIDGALAAHRLVVDEDVQLSFTGPREGARFSVSRVWPTARDRHPAAALAPGAAIRVAELLRSVTEGASILRSAHGVSFADGRSFADEPVLLAPFGGGGPGG